MRIESLSNGLGGQSMYCAWLAGQGRIPATISISADTGSEQDCDWNTGEKTSARYYFEQVAKPLLESWGIDAYFVRAVDTGVRSISHGIVSEMRRQLMPVLPACSPLE